ncbi:hypothetical protein VULLAG_LOCUS14988 [Vulpes lagopus]
MGFVTYTGRTRSPAVSVHSLDRHAVTEAPGLPPRQPRRALGAGVRVPPQGSERFVPSGSGRVCCRSRVPLATLSGTGPALRHLIGRNYPP